MFAQPILLDQVAISVLEKVFLNSLSADGLSTKRFRISNHEHLDLLDSLEQGNYITQTGDKYYLKIEALFEIAETRPEAKEYIDLGKQLFLLVQQEYRDDPDQVLSLNYLAEKSELSRKNLNIILSYMVEAPFIFGGRTTDLTQEDAYICPAESVLKYKSLDEVIAQVRSWRKPRGMEEYAQVNFFRSKKIGDFSFLLHPEIIEHALSQYQNGHLRNAVLDSMIAVFDFIRLRTGLKDDDGDRLIGKVFSIDDPYLILSEIDTESGKNDQKGFMQIFKGTYQGIRNPKAHKLDNDLTELKAAQYLVFASMLIRRIEEAKLMERDLKS